jgi:hypothetical protein
MGFLLIVYEIKKDNFRCGICKPDGLENRTTLYKGLYPQGNMVHTQKIKHSFGEKIMYFLLKERLTRVANEEYQGNLNDIKIILEIVAKVEEDIVNENISLQDILQNLKNKTVIQNTVIQNDPEVPGVRKARRAVDQINKETGIVIASFQSLEEAGRAIGVTGTSVGIAIRNKSLCKGFLLRYAGISHDEQYKDQPVIKVCCSTGEKTYFKNMADAGRDVNISAPGLRNRILTKVHIDDHHWIFDKNASHYA